MVALSLGNWHVEYGSSGGFTGGGTGYHITSDGRVSKWTVYLAGEEPVYEPVGQADVSGLAQALAGLEGVKLDEPSNMTASFSWGGGRLCWPVGATMPVPVERAVTAANEVVRSLGLPPPPGL